MPTKKYETSYFLLIVVVATVVTFALIKAVQG